jgi:hypothetical protein
MRLNKISLKDKALFEKYLALRPHQLSVYSFANIYIWKSFFDISWVVIDDSLCVFFKDKIGSFLYLPPLGLKESPSVISEIFKFLDKENKNLEFSHIENVESQDLEFYKDLGFDCVLKSHDYICNSQDLALLEGNNFKSKRASCNYFSKHFDYTFDKLSLKDVRDCLKLYSVWAKQRQVDNRDKIYLGMLEDSRVTLKEAFSKYRELGFRGIRVKVDNKIRGFTFGFALNKDTFCILFEITDLSIKGLAQFIFREFSRELKDYRYINIMDDSGLDNLKEVKLSYHPKMQVPAYIIRRRLA